ncbi:unnamed protein product [Caenorhabditis nigoni]
MQPVKSTLPNSYSQVSTNASMSKGDPGAVMTTPSNVSSSSGCLFPDVGFADASSLNSLTTCFSPVRRRGTNGADILPNFYYVTLAYYGLTQLADLVGMVGRIRHLARSVMASEGTRSFLDSSEH